MNKKELQARLADAKMRGQAIFNKSEQRELTDEDIACLDKIKAEIDKYKKLLDCIKDIDTPAEEENSDEGGGDKDKEDDEPPKADPIKKDERTFRSLGEQMMAVYRASQPGSRIDTRLTTRSASGLNATNPSDGGFLVQTDFVKDLLKRTYDTGILASKCKRIPLTTNANSLKINAIDEISRANGSRWGGLQTYWENEADQFTASKPKFRQMELSLKKLTGLCYATDELLQDASALEKVIKEGFAEEFGVRPDRALLKVA
ncbi:MAG: phage major capsid protein [Firmicutes bacterium]|nr:phage major capsid protein [Bacillota bacterium]